MSKQIWKYPLALLDTQEIRMPFEAEILSLQIQNNIPTVWALVEPSDTLVGVRFHIVGTGHPVEDSVITGNFIGTVQMDSGLVFHVWVS